MGLAEPKRKVKYSIDPNALHWANNEDKFGQKLMEKMGWEKGKGLGAKEDGMTEHIKVKFKQDNKGIGYNNNEYENVWLDHQDDFEKLLSNLSQNNSKEKETIEAKNGAEESAEDFGVKSLVEKSKQSRRLHYKKFAKSKDLSSVTANDLNCILGSKKRSEIAQREAEDTKANLSQDSQEEDVDSFRATFSLNKTELKQENGQDKKEEEFFGLKFSTNKLSVSDYFANKMASKLNLIKNSETEQNIKKESEEENHNNQEEVNKKEKKKKNKNKEEELVQEESKKKSEVLEIPVKIEIVQQENQEEPEKKKKTKKSKENKEQIEVESLNISVKSEEIESVVEPSEENGQEEPVKKKKKKSKKEKDEENDGTIGEEEEKIDLHVQAKSAFQGSNLLSLHGYSAYQINSNLEQAINEKVKKLDRKRKLVSKKLEIDVDFYKMNKKMNC